MIKHIVMWRLQDFAEGASKNENAEKIKNMYADIKELIPEVLHLEIGINAFDSPAAYDIVLYSEFESFAALEIYRKHPEHKKRKDFTLKVISDRVVVDYEK